MPTVTQENKIDGGKLLIVRTYAFDLDELTSSASFQELAVQSMVKPVVQPKKKRKLRPGKKWKDMSHEEKKARWREDAKAKRDKKTGIAKPASDSVSNEKLERMQKLGNKIKKVERVLNEIPERT